MEKTINLNTYMHKINRIEIMLNELKQGLLVFDKDFQESINNGERDIKEGKVTICKTECDLDTFFASV